jgi:hypothetical protein
MRRFVGLGLGLALACFANGQSSTGQAGSSGSPSQSTTSSPLKLRRGFWGRSSAQTSATADLDPYSVGQDESAKETARRKRLSDEKRYQFKLKTNGSLSATLRSGSNSRHGVSAAAMRAYLSSHHPKMTLSGIPGTQPFKIPDVPLPVASIPATLGNFGQTREGFGITSAGFGLRSNFSSGRSSTPPRTSVKSNIRTLSRDGSSRRTSAR